MTQEGLETEPGRLRVMLQFVQNWDQAEVENILALSTGLYLILLIIIHLKCSVLLVMVTMTITQLFKKC
ncbi:hypothetical protein BIY27_10555 [Gibbsiella quercinecans]|nr:hypothetical protein BIY27_10555 [Gibbsiella quercinecans]